MFGNSKAAKSARVKQQLRDKNGRWIEMGGLVKYTNGSNSFSGKVRDIDPDGMEEPGLVRVEVVTKTHPDYGAILTVRPENLEAINEKAILDNPEPKPYEKPKDSISFDVPAPGTEDLFEKEFGKDFDKKVNSSSYLYEKFGKDGIAFKYSVEDSAFKNFPGYTIDEQHAMEDYVNDYFELNSSLRIGRDMSYSRTYRGLLSAIDKSPLAEPTTVYRGVRANADMIKKMQKNSVYFDKAFTSTSSNEKVPSGIVNDGFFIGNEKVSPLTLEINLPKGFKAHKFDYKTNDGQGFERFTDEEEVLLPPNTAFRILSIEQNENGSYKAVAEPILTKFNSIGTETNDEEAARMAEEAQKKPKKWGLFSLAAAELAIGSKLSSSNGIIIEKVSDELWEHKTTSNKISYNNRSIDCLKSLETVDFNVETA